MLSADSLRDYKCKDLAQMAKQRGVAGWHSMRKDDLIRAILKTVRRPNGSKNGTSGSKESAGASRRSKSAGEKGAGGGKGRSEINGKKEPAPKAKPTAVQRKIQRAHAKREKMMDLGTATSRKNIKAQNGVKDRVVLMVRDPYWLHAHWDLSPQAVQRARAALSQDWHSARPVLRLLHMPNDAISHVSEQVIRIIDIHGAVKNWYIDVADPPSSYLVEIGYLTSSGRFHALGRSNAVTTPRPGSADMIDSNWADVVENSEKIYAMSGGYDGHAKNAELQQLFEERLRRPMGSPMVTRFGDGAEAVLKRERGMAFNVDAEMIVYGMTDPDAFVTLAGEPVKLGPDGSFTARVSLPDRRRVLPVVASSRDGVEERTIVLAVERNTKVMEPKMREPGQ